MNQSDPTPAEPGIRDQLLNTLAFVRRALGFWQAPLAALLVGGAAFAAFLYFRQPAYRSETVVLYAEKGNSDAQVESNDVQRNVNVRLRELLFSRPNLEHLVSSFDLYPELRQRYGMVEAVEELKKHIDFRAPGGDTFSIAFDGKSPRQAQEVTAELARRVIDGDAELRKTKAKAALDFLVSERNNRDAELRAAEEELASFMSAHPRFALDATPLASGAAIRASMPSGVETPAKSTWMPQPRPAAQPRQAAGATPTSAPAPASGEQHVAPSLGKSVEAELVRARAALAAARENLNEKLTRFTPAHPDVRAAEGEVQRATERLAAATNAAAASGPGVGSVNAAASPGAADAKPGATATASAAPKPSWATAPRPAAAASAPASGKGEDLVTLETSWLKLTRAVTEARQRLDLIEAQLFRADIDVSSAKDGRAVQVHVIDPAYLPQTPQPPGKTTLGLLFLAGALVLGVLAALVMALFDQRVLTARDLAGVTDVLVEVPGRKQRSSHVAS